MMRLNRIRFDIFRENIQEKVLRLLFSIARSIRFSIIIVSIVIDENLQFVDLGF